MIDREGLTYVYAVAPETSKLRAALSDVRGVSGGLVSLLGEDVPAEGAERPGSLAFVTSRVAQNEFDERTLKARFEDLGWLEEVARAHHEVVQTIARHDTVLPLRLATLYENDDRARRALATQRHVFAERIALLQGRSEWGVKLYISSAGPPASPEGPADPGGTTTLSPGKAYLQRRRAQHHVQEDRYRSAQEAARRIEVLVSRYTAHRVRHPAQHGELAGPEENVLNDAYLVPDDLTESFRTALAALAADLGGVRVEVTGPWAPYSFAMPPPLEPASDDVRQGPAR
ncbi:GvpL/GvpF family gas vesicle protein [Streptomyces sp. TX20-6-3]|uniref:GvpL/GvpF family gas vesicle protein n=1 Tax=Streptomyces sp. TX20-6-3 TaxID=3028705 RepID=UPI0029B37304|nr:GvpL/GvpF family gas vesicle protein [Streptomyces sp. TX20-6-3]MDX2560872.1 GvpL/GvpF family gas vesicle protein [Streptomyces sp. TX20-6-3]